MTRRGWTDWEYGVVAENADMTLAELADELGRSIAGVKHARWKLRNGWTRAQETTEAWTSAEDAVLLANKFATAPEAANLVGRSTEAVRKRRRALKDMGHELPHWTGNASPFRPGARPILAQTCPDCGLLLQAKWFTIVSGAWRKRCTRCHSNRSEPARRGLRNKSDQARRSKESAEKYQALTLPNAKNNGNPYTEADIKTLSDPDLTLFQKALILKRSYMAVAGAAHRYGYPSAVGLGDPERDQWMIDNPNAKEYAA